MSDILCIDDSPDYIDAVKRLFSENDDYTFTTVTSEKAAKDAVNKGAYSLVLCSLDLVSPDKTNKRLFANSLKKHKNIPVIFISTQGIEDDLVENCYESGGIDLLMKPVSARLLLYKIRLFTTVYETSEELKRKNFVLEVHAKARKKAEKESHDKSRFLAVMSHELRTPLIAINGYSDLLKLGAHGNLSEKQHFYNDGIRRNGSHLLNLIKDLLFVGKSELDKISLDIKQIAISEFLKSIIEAIESIAEENNITIVLKNQCSIDSFFADELRIRQAVLNIVMNAIKFSFPGNDVIVTVSEEQSDWFVLTIQDFGIGIDPKDSENVFAQFKQIDSKNSRKFDGTGLGMFISKKIVEQHHGGIGFESEGENKGTIFTIKLPLNLGKC